MLCEIVGLVLLLPVAAIATWQICEIWNHGSIFAEWRQIVSTLQGYWLCRLLDCMFCLANWVALLCVLLCYAAVTWSVWWALPVAVFATARLANLGNDLSKAVLSNLDLSTNDRETELRSTDSSEG
jgi:hypothetical protein